MSEPQRCLFITTFTDNRLERENIASQLDARGVVVDFHDWEGMIPFQQKFQGSRYDLLYLSSHADSTGFGENTWENKWSNFADAVCQTDCMLPEAVLFLACCRGGLKTLALNMLSICNKIDYIVGPVWKAKGGDITNAFRAFCECCYSKKDGTREDPCKIAECLSAAGGQTFACYDRVDMECDLEIFRRLRSIDEQVYTNFTLLKLINLQNAKIMEAVGISNVSPKKDNPEEPAAALPTKS